MTKPSFFTRHGPIIALVVKPGEMQHSVKHENLDLSSRRMPQPRSVLRGDVGGNRDFSNQR